MARNLTEKQAKIARLLLWLLLPRALTRKLPPSLGRMLIKFEETYAPGWTPAPGVPGQYIPPPGAEIPPGWTEDPNNPGYYIPPEQITPIQVPITEPGNIIPPQGIGPGPSGPLPPNPTQPQAESWVSYIGPDYWGEDIYGYWSNHHYVTDFDSLYLPVAEGATWNQGFRPKAVRCTYTVDVEPVELSFYALNPLTLLADAYPYYSGDILELSLSRDIDEICFDLDCEGMTLINIEFLL